jgi:hypothetical protein
MTSRSGPWCSAQQLAAGLVVDLLGGRPHRGDDGVAMLGGRNDGGDDDD